MLVRSLDFEYRWYSYLLVSGSQPSRAGTLKHRPESRLNFASAIVSGLWRLSSLEKDL